MRLSAASTRRGEPREAQRRLSQHGNRHNVDENCGSRTEKRIKSHNVDGKRHIMLMDKQEEDNCETVGQKKSNLEGLGPEKELRRVCILSLGLTC